jgi:cytochrome oxidase Cu insertion factor (SCO1/SenC/PrrC family)
MPRRAILLFAAAVLAIAAVVAASAFLGRVSVETRVGKALIGGPFSLVDQDGKRVTEQDFRGKYMLVFFGYTYCPDVCPTELQVMMAALDQMGGAGKDIVPVFVSVDPERDSPETIKAYVGNFGPRLVGLTGTPEEIAAIAKAYRVYYAKGASKDGDDYLMDHSSIIYLMDPNGSFVKHFAYTTDAARLADNLKEALTGSS